MNIVVLAGGLSSERDVSIITGQKVAQALRENGHKICLLDVYMGYENDNIDNIFNIDYDFTRNITSIGETAPDLEKIKASRTNQNPKCFLGKNVVEICRMADIVFMALHGDVGENGKLQATFDILGIKYTGSGYLGSGLAMNKSLSKKMFLTSGVPTPQGKLYVKDDNTEDWSKFPCVVKPCSGGSSVGVAIPQNKAEFDNAMAEAFALENEVLVEEYIKGREFSVGVVAGKALPIIEICPKEGFYDYKNKYQAGLTDDICPAQLPDEITSAMQRMAERVCDTLMLEAYSRVDFLLDKENNMYCLEANTLPGMTPTSLLPQEALAQGISYTELVEMLVQQSLEKYN
ncbi:MAG: D-alanine--D-alanine ligase [Acutalibacteraceae bacterium]|nr:D-alanine--D-alanine ligase [Acutalibacteraceae bacterium]